MDATKPAAAPLQPTSWGDRWFAWRNRLLANPAFQRHAAAWWPTRWIARRRAAQLFDLVAGFVYSQVLLALVRLRVPDMLIEGPLTAQEIAVRCGLPVPSAQRLLAAGAALRLLEQRGEAWGLGELGAPLAGNPGLQAMIEHHEALYADLADPLALLRGGPAQGRLRAYWPYAGAAQAEGLPQQAVAGYTRLMAVSQSLVAEEILDAYPFARHRHLLDVGGGDGSFLASVSQRCPGLQLSLFDLPGVAAIAAARLGSAARVTGGSFHDALLPAGADVASLVRVVHDQDDEAALALLRRVAQALPAGGTLVIAEPMAGTPGAEAMGDAYFGMYLLAMGSGRPRTETRLRELLAQAGFGEVRMHPTRQPLTVRVMSARRINVNLD